MSMIGVHACWEFVADEPGGGQLEAVAGPLPRDVQAALPVVGQQDTLQPHYISYLHMVPLIRGWSEYDTHMGAEHVIWSI